jgi:hypothetical protein
MMAKNRSWRWRRITTCLFVFFMHRNQVFLNNKKKNKLWKLKRSDCESWSDEIKVKRDVHKSQRNRTNDRILTFVLLI